MKQTPKKDYSRFGVGAGVLLIAGGLGAEIKAQMTGQDNFAAVIIAATGLFLVASIAVRNAWKSSEGTRDELKRAVWINAEHYREHGNHLLGEMRSARGVSGWTAELKERERALKARWASRNSGS